MDFGSTHTFSLNIRTMHPMHAHIYTFRWHPKRRIAVPTAFLQMIHLIRDGVASAVSQVTSLDPLEAESSREHHLMRSSSAEPPLFSNYQRLLSYASHNVTSFCLLHSVFMTLYIFKVKQSSPRKDVGISLGVFFRYLWLNTASSSCFGSTLLLCCLLNGEIMERNA